MSVTFDSVGLTNPRITAFGYPLILNNRILLDGRASLKGNANAGLGMAFRCYTLTLSDITSLAAKIGTKGTLAVGSTNYTNMMISGFDVKPIENFTQWEYFVSFLKHTAV